MRGEEGQGIARGEGERRSTGNRVADFRKILNKAPIGSVDLHIVEHQVQITWG